MKRKYGGEGRLRAVLSIAMLALAGFSGVGWSEEETAGDEGMWTNTYIVPPNIHRRLEERAEEFEREREEERKNTEGIKVRLEGCGIQFPEGASVVYNPSSSTLIFRNTKEQIALLEPLIESIIKTSVVKQVFITIREIRYDPDALRKEIGDREGTDWLFWAPQKVANKDLPRGSTAAKAVIPEAELLEVMSQLPVRPPPESKWANERGIAATFTDPQFQMVIRSFSQKKGFDWLKPPSLLLRSEQAGLSQVDTKRWGVVAKLGENEFGPDESSIFLSLYLPPEGKALFPEDAKVREPTLRVSLPDGHTVAYHERVAEDEVRIVFVTARIVDPAGLSITPKEKSEKPKPEAVPVKSRPAAEIEKERDAARAANRIALRGYDKLLAGDFKDAAADFEAALGKLPKDRKDDTRRLALQAQLKKAQAGLKSLGKPNEK